MYLNSFRLNSIVQQNSIFILIYNTLHVKYSDLHFFIKMYLVYFRHIEGTVIIRTLHTLCVDLVCVCV